MKNYRIIKLTNISLSTICGIEANVTINIWNNKKFIDEYKWQIKDNLINGNFICHDSDYMQVPLDISLIEVDDMIQDTFRYDDQSFNISVGKIIVTRFKEDGIKKNVDSTVSPNVFSKLGNVFDLLLAGMLIEAKTELQSLPNDNLLTNDVKTFYCDLIENANCLVSKVDNPMNTGIPSIAGTYSKVVVDNYGKVKSGSNPDINISDVTGLTTQLNSKIDIAAIGQVNGVASLDNTGRVPSTQLPSYVDDVITVANYSSLPSTGEDGKIYITLNTNLTYRWNGIGYTEISPSLALGETSATAYRGDRGKTAYDHANINGNPHGTDFSELENKPTTLVGYGITDAAEKYHAFPIASTFGEATTSLYGHVKKAQYMTKDDTGVVPSNLMYTNITKAFHTAAGTAGQAGWIKVCSLVCAGGYTDEPITMTLARRGAYKPCKLTIRFLSIAQWTANISVASFEGTDYAVYYYKSADDTHDIYVNKAEPYDRCHITEFKSPYNIQVNPQNTQVTTPPESSVRFTRIYSDYFSTGKITSQDWNTYTSMGVYSVVGWSGSNGPTGSYRWGQLVVSEYDGVINQTFYPHLADAVISRQYFDGVWSGWRSGIQKGNGFAPSTTMHFQTLATSRPNANDVYLCY